MNVLILGPQGYLGKRFQSVFPDATGSDADIADAVQVAEALEKHHPDPSTSSGQVVVINCAGKTGSPNVDWCEDHKEETLRSNTLGPLILLEECAKRRIYWVHLSTGCIYDSFSSSEPAEPSRLGPKGLAREKQEEGESKSSPLYAFTEEDPPNFFGSFYSRSKGWADQILRDFPSVLQLRLRMPFDNHPDPRNLITKLVRYPRVLDAENSLTYVPDLLSVAKILIERRATGTYNIVNPGTLSPYRVMELYREIVDPSHRFERLTLAELPSAVRAGRSNCMLSTKKLEAAGIHLQPAEEAMRGALRAYRAACKPVSTGKDAIISPAGGSHSGNCIAL